MKNILLTITKICTIIAFILYVVWTLGHLEIILYDNGGLNINWLNVESNPIWNIIIIVAVAFESTGLLLAFHNIKRKNKQEDNDHDDKK